MDRFEIYLANKIMGKKVREMGQEQFHIFWLINEMASNVSLGNSDHWFGDMVWWKAMAFSFIQIGSEVFKTSKRKISKSSWIHGSRAQRRDLGI